MWSPRGSLLPSLPQSSRPSLTPPLPQNHRLSPTPTAPNPLHKKEWGLRLPPLSSLSGLPVWGEWLRDHSGQGGDQNGGPSPFTTTQFALKDPLSLFKEILGGQSRRKGSLLPNASLGMQPTPHLR